MERISTAQELRETFNIRHTHSTLHNTQSITMVHFNLTALAAAATAFSITDFQGHFVDLASGGTTDFVPVRSFAKAENQNQEVSVSSMKSYARNSDAVDGISGSLFRLATRTSSESRTTASGRSYPSRLPLIWGTRALLGASKRLPTRTLALLGTSLEPEMASSSK